MSKHLSDEELLCLIDAEAPPHRAVEMEAHMECCPACRGRHRALQAASSEVAALCRKPAVPALQFAASRGHIGEAIKANIERRWARRAPVTVALTAALLFFSVRFESTLLHRATIVERGALPVRTLTPGLARAVSADELCGAKPRAIPPVPAAVRMQVLSDYGMENIPPTEYELDYLITPELGGLADRRNLWPEPYGLRSWNAHAKDVLENRLPRMVCRGEIDLETAQRDIASNWIGAYKKYLTAEPRIELHARLLELPHSRLPIGD